MLEKLLNLPTPLQIILDSASIIVISMFFILMIAEELFPGRSLPKIKFWKFKGISALIIYFFLSSYLPLIWNETVSNYQIFNLSSLGNIWEQS